MAYPQEILVQAKALLAAKQEAVAKQSAAMRTQIAAKLPQALALEREIASTSAQIAAALLSQENVAHKVEEIREFNLQKRAELAHLLLQNGFSANALEPRYFCDRCNDTGIEQTKICHCLRSIQQQLMYQKLGNTSPISEADFATFGLSWYSTEPLEQVGASPHQIMSKTLAVCKSYAAQFDCNAGSLLFVGDPGLGKTHLSLAIAKVAIEKGFDVLYLPFHGLLTKLEGARFGKIEGNYLEYIAPALDCELLVLDDVGSEFQSSFASAALYEIVNTRLIHKLPTIISTNLSDEELAARYSKRTASRLIGCYQVIPFVGQDIRIQKRYNR